MGTCLSVEVEKQTQLTKFKPRTVRSNNRGVFDIYDPSHLRFFNSSENVTVSLPMLSSNLQYQIFDDIVEDTVGDSRDDYYQKEKCLISSKINSNYSVNVQILSKPFEACFGILTNFPKETVISHEYNTYPLPNLWGGSGYFLESQGVISKSNGDGSRKDLKYLEYDAIKLGDVIGLKLISNNQINSKTSIIKFLINNKVIFSQKIQNLKYHLCIGARFNDERFMFGIKYNV